MKFKLLSSLFLGITLAFIFTTTTSSDNGYYNNGTSCGTCHGNAPSTSTSVSLTGLPASFVPNQTYNLTFTITNASLTHGGFNILCSGGQFTAGTGSKTNTAKTQITHSAVSATNTWSFTWKAPATTGAVTFSAVGNAVNNDGNESSLDKWNTATYTVSGSFPTSLDHVKTSELNCYPNPAFNQVFVTGVSHVKVMNMFGQIIPVVTENRNDELVLHLNNLPSGMYRVLGQAQGKWVSTTLVKQ